jgi:hypothetical protein
MLENYIVSRTAYDHDINALRDRISEMSKELRRAEIEKGELNLQIAMNKSQIGGLQADVVRFQKKAQASVREIKEFLEPVPVGETPRGEYMAQVAGIFEGGLKDKLNYMQTQFRNQTGMFPLTERETDFFRACINVVGLLLDWGEECVAEHRSNILNISRPEQENAFDIDSEAVENIKRSVTSN